MGESRLRELILTVTFQQTLLADLRDDKIYPRINRRDYAATMYPPLAQFTYLLTTRISESVTWMKATMLLFEVVTIWALLHLLTSFGLSRERVLLYAWHPLIVWEVAGSGHVDAIVIAFICLALLAPRRNGETSEMMDRLVQPIIEGTDDFVIGSRTRGLRERGSMNHHQVFAGYAIGVFLRMLYGVRSTDMGPFRAIRRDALETLGMREETYGWPLEMQMRAGRARLKTLEVPVDYRRRVGGQSKIAGTVRGSILAATRILTTFARIALERL
jgi:hypothetical protein